MAAEVSSHDVSIPRMRMARLYLIVHTYEVISLFPSRTVALELFGFGIHWYGLMYMLGFVLGAILLPRLQKYRGLTLSQDDWSKILTATILGVIIGGRLGFVLLYEPVYYLSHPLQIFAVWKGGMASHGGFIGVILALTAVLHKKSINQVLRIADVVVIPVALGLMFGRIGNFINLELYGTVTTLPWGINIPGVEGLRHPTQIYAATKDLLIATACFWHLKAAKNAAPGRTTAIFLMMYGVLRFMNEFFLVQDYPNVDLILFTLSRGQLFTLPIFCAGALLWVWAGRQNARQK